MDQSIREDSRINTLFVPGFAKRRCLLILVNESCRMKARSSICTCPSFGTRSVFCSDGLEAGLVKKALVVAVDRRSFSVAARVAPAEVGTGHWALGCPATCWVFWAVWGPPLVPVFLGPGRGSLHHDGHHEIPTLRLAPMGILRRMDPGIRKRKPENAFTLPLSPQGLEPPKASKTTPDLCLRLKGSSGLSKAPVGLRTTRVSFSN